MDDYTKSRLIEMADGSYVESDVLGVVEKIRDYDSSLRLKYNDGINQEISEAPYALFEMCPDGIERLIFEIWELDDRVLERIYAADNAKNNVLLGIDGRNLIAKMEETRRYKEETDEIEDIIVKYLQSPKTRFSFIAPISGNKVTLDSQEGVPAKVEYAL